MGLNLDSIIHIVSLLGGGSVGAILTWQFTRRKAKAEADMAVQDVYQQLLEDVKNDRNEQKEYIHELKEDRRHLREERDALRARIDKTDEALRELQAKTARFGRQLEGLMPFLCGKVACKNRIHMSPEDACATTEKPTRQKK